MMSNNGNNPLVMAPDQPVAERGLLRIGELSRRHGLTPDVLRAWERRYGLLRPERSPGGFRLYTPSDDERVRAMRRNMSRGFSPAVAARMALRDAPARPADGPTRLASARLELGDALESFRDVEAQAVLDGLLSAFSVETVVRDVVLPYLHDLGERWAAGDVSVAQEHFASEVIRGRLLGLARGWDTGAGPRALLACPPDEHHDLGLICFGLGLREHGWRITYIGADSPVPTMRDAAVAVEPRVIVVCAEREEPLDAVVDELAVLAADWPLALAGRGASAELARRAGARLLQDAPMAAAARLAAEAAGAA